MIEELARERLGFERLRPGQLRAVQALADGRDVLAVLPTGGGKSAIYELAGLLALTATAAPPVRQEIVRRLGLGDPEVVIGDFDWPHIALSARRMRTLPDKQRELVRAPAEVPFRWARAS